jgi:hypothetical protein
LKVFTTVERPETLPKEVTTPFEEEERGRLPAATTTHATTTGTGPNVTTVVPVAVRPDPGPIVSTSREGGGGDTGQEEESPPSSRSPRKKGREKEKTTGERAKEEFEGVKEKSKALFPKLGAFFRMSSLPLHRVI